MKGLKLHIENAIGYGGTPQEILEIMEMASVLGIRAAPSAVPILPKEIDAAGWRCPTTSPDPRPRARSGIRWWIV
ncbi:hypothetical protein GCM10010464_49780 [Pseudonocardia yunnanensis]|uniref:Uncharacterized protein n=1 Tax=Pseudonocardia yunnanensis TaxID=58107 RepID=A0ABW4EUQ7_9PSEU